MVQWVKTLHFHCKGCRFDPWSKIRDLGNVRFHMPPGEAKKKKKSVTK